MIGQARWTVGEDHGLAWDHGVAILGRDLDLATVDKIWEELAASGTRLPDFLTVLSNHTGATLLELPPFAVALVGAGGLHVAVRGGLRVEAVLDDGTREIVTGAGVSTWSERMLPGSGWVLLEVDGASADAVARPTRGGVVPAARILLGDPVAVEEAASEEVAPPEVVAEVEVPEVEVPEVEAPQVEASDAEVPDAEVPEVEAADEESPPYVGSEEEPLPDIPLADIPLADIPLADIPLADIPVADEPVVDPPGRFAHLWADHTLMSDIESAAIRTSDDADEPATGQPAPVDPALLDPAPLDPAPVDSAPALPVPAPTLTEVEEEPAAPEAGDGFIDSVPRSGRSRPLAQQPVPDVEPDEELGDHDGHTILSLDEEPPAALATPASPTGDTILAVLCPASHANPVERSACRVCGLPVSGEPVRMERPSLGRLVASTGETIALTVPVIVGRQPRVSRTQSTQMPRLLPLPFPHISATHLEIRLEGWAVLAVDLKSLNGSHVRRPGQPPMRLPEQPTLLAAGDVIDLGHGVVLSFEELP